MSLITPRKVNFSAPVQARMWDYVEKQVQYLWMKNQSFRDTVIPEWTRQLKGIPQQETKNFPFPNASNLVIQLIASRVEQMLARAMVLYSVDPLWTVGATGDLIGQDADEQAKMLEQFLSDMAIDPEELNLYRKEELLIHDGIAYGTALVGFPWQYITEEQAVSIPGATVGVNRQNEFKTIVTKDGPVPENIPLTRMLIDNRAKDLESARFVGIQRILTREAVEDRIAFGIWTKEVGEAILRQPDTQNSATRTTKDNKELYPIGDEYDAEYHIYECYFKFVHDGKKFAIKADYHMQSKTHANAVFNYFPKNCLPLEDLRFGYDTESYFGYGFIEMLKSYQQELSQIHNNRLDNEAIRNNISFRINKDSELASTLKFYPGVTVPADEGEVDVLETQGQAMDNMASESATTAMANDRCGIDPATSGMGGGVVNPKRGIYSSQGTLAVLQQQNNRTGLRMMDVRGTHVKIGRKLVDMYAHLGIGKRLARYGQQSDKLRKALASVRAGDLGLILKASSAATNIETDRQNSILLQGLQEKYIGIVNQITQQMQMGQVNDDQKKYLEDVLFAEQSLTRHIFRVFGHYDVDKLVPFPEWIKNERAARQQQEQQAKAQSSAGSQRAIAAAVPSVSTRPPETIPTTPTGGGAS